MPLPHPRGRGPRRGCLLSAARDEYRRRRVCATSKRHNRQPLVAETIAREGFASIVIDQQHGLWDTASTLAAIAAVRQGVAGVDDEVGDYLLDLAFVRVNRPQIIILPILELHVASGEVKPCTLLD